MSEPISKLPNRAARGMPTYAMVFVVVLIALLAACAGPSAISETDSVPSSEMRYEKQYREVLGTRMAYVDVGAGDPIVFLHGNPTSSYLWRNVLPHLEGKGRLIAPDLIGMGDSAKIPPSDDDGRDGRYSFVEHRRHLDALLDELGVEKDVVLVIHDWGSALGFDWARRNPERVRGIAYMEALLRPIRFDRMPFVGRLMFKAFRSWAGETLILRGNVFVNTVLPNSIIRELSDEEMAAYQAPYVNSGEDRRPTLTWPREVPIDGEPVDTTEILSNYADWLPETEIPKLLIVADPGVILAGPLLEFARTFKNQQEVAFPVYYMFPNVILNVGQNSITVVRVLPHPDEVGRSVSHVSFYHDPDQLNVPNALFTPEQFFERFATIIRDEDYPTAVLAQRSAEAGLQDSFLLGRNEPTLQHFHNTYRKVLGQSPLEPVLTET